MVGCPDASGYVAYDCIPNLADGTAAVEHVWRVTERQ